MARSEYSPTINAENAKRLCDDPASFFANSLTNLHSIRRENLEMLQLAGLQYRFETLKPKIPMLSKLADKQGINQLCAVDDVVPLLFEHTIYKSYPPSLLEKHRFKDINRWLSKLTVHDLTGIDVSDCNSIDDWMSVMDNESPLNISHSSGTSGTMSFLPISKDEFDRFGRTMRVQMLQEFGKEPDNEDSDEIYCIYPFFRSGSSSHLRNNDVTVKYIVGSEERLLTAYPGRMSSDILYLSAKIKAASARGELDRLQISPSLLERKKKFEHLEKVMPDHLDNFLDESASKLQGKRLYFAGTWNLLHSMAERQLAKGRENVFASDSVIASGGGAKGMTPPDNWEEDVCRFFGIEHLKKGYAMSEVMAMHQMCEHGHYHFAPWVIPFVLDPDTSAILPREGVTTGRAAFFDLGADSHWGGFISGDEISVHWDEPCPCGRSTIYASGEIQRYSDKRGGDDKITCAATESAHKEAMDFLSKFVA